MAKKITSAKRVGRNKNRPTNKRYVSENHQQRNKERRAARITKALAKAKAHTPNPNYEPPKTRRLYRPLTPQTLSKEIGATARIARAVSKTIARLEERYPTNNDEFVAQLNAVYRSPANQRVNHRLRRLRRAIPTR